MQAGDVAAGRVKRLADSLLFFWLILSDLTGIFAN